ncbi:hypothetical protein B0H21DRAFT_679118, partial [Amylocystis lapponica]
FMTPALSVDLKERIVQLYAQPGSTMAEIVKTLDCSIGLVSKVVNLHRVYGQVTNPTKHRTGCPSFLDHADHHYLQTILAANPCLYLDEIQHKLATVRHVD